MAWHPRPRAHTHASTGGLDRQRAFAREPVATARTVAAMAGLDDMWRHTLHPIEGFGLCALPCQVVAQLGGVIAAAIGVGGWAGLQWRKARLSPFLFCLFFVCWRTARRVSFWACAVGSSHPRAHRKNPSPRPFHSHLHPLNPSPCPPAPLAPLHSPLRFCGARRPKPPLASAEQPTGGGAGRAPSPETRDGSGGSDADAGAGGRGGSLQVALFSATLSAEARHSIGKSFPRMELCFTPCAHRAPPTLKHRLLHVEGDRMELLLDQAKALGPRAPALVFCRGIDSARAVQMRLAEAGLSVAGCHGGMPDEARAEVLAAFAAGRHAILVATDLAARGLHLPHVGTVINFDFPASSALYLHRAGRTARC